jgi:hypothetical protein
MGLTIRFRGGDHAGKKLTVKDDVSMVVFGRDREKCQVVFPPDETKVGREHFALKRVLGRYRLVLNADNLVLVNGRPAVDDQELEEIAEVQLGPGGPKLVVERWSDSDLSATMAQGRRPSKGTLLEQAHATARSTRRLALATVLLVAGLGAAGWWLLSRTGEQVDTLTSDLATVKAGQAEFVQGAVAEVNQRIAGVQQRMAELQPRMKPLLERAAESVYLVLLRDANGDEEGVGTAWVVGEDALATNAHVAQVFQQKPDTVTFLVREAAERGTGSATPKEWEVQSVEIHPGYEAFTEIWFQYRPATGSTIKNLNELQPAGAACDVGLLRIAAGAGLRPALKLAEKTELRDLTAGDLVGFVGFPMERMAIGGVNLKWPQPTTQIGHVTSVTDYFGVDVEDAEGHNLGHLVQHALPATGGASGSPILDEHGHVVAVLSAGNVIEAVLRIDPSDPSRAEKARLPLPAGVNFAQRADLVYELLEGTAAAAQAERTRAWRESMTAFTSGAEVQQRVTMEQMLGTWTTNLTTQSQFTYAYEPEQVSRQKAAFGTDDSTATVAASLPDEGHYFVIATTSGAQVMEMSVDEASSGSRWPGDGVPGWYQYSTFQAAAGGEIQVVLKGDKAGTPLEVHVYRAKGRPFTADEVHRRMVSDWEQVLLGRTGGAYRAVPLLTVAGALTAHAELEDTGAAVHPLEIPREGYYLVVAVAPDRVNIDLLVAELIGEERNVFVKDEMEDHFPVTPFDAQGPTHLEVYVVGRGGDTVGAKYDLRVYVAEPAGN